MDKTIKTRKRNERQLIPVGFATKVLKRGRLGAYLYRFEVPNDLIKIAKRYNRNIFGVNVWNSSTPELRNVYFCIATPQGTLTYIENELIEEIKGK